METIDQLQQMKMLLVDDDEWVREALSLFAEVQYWNLQTVETAEEALEALEAQHYDMVIVDYMLPGMDGLEFLRRIQKSHPGVMKLLITAYGSAKLFLELKALGIADYLEKPFSSKAIESYLRRMIEKQELEIRDRSVGRQ